jgi:hypothetical protein
MGALVVLSSNVASMHGHLHYLFGMIMLTAHCVYQAETSEQTILPQFSAGTVHICVLLLVLV